MLKRIKIKEVLTAVMMVVFMVSSVACSKTTPTPIPTLTPVPTEDPALKDGPMVKYPTPVELTVSNITSPSFKYIDGEDEDNNFHTRMNLEYLNIVYKTKWVVADTKLDEKINLSIASNDLPDAISVNASQLQSLIKNDQIQDMTKIWERYPTPELRANEEYQNKVGFVPSTKNGKIYGMPLTGDFGESIPILYVRKDWLAKVGLTAPKTIDELINVAKAFVNNDPDGNSKKDTYALALDMNLGRTTMDSIAAAYKAYYKMWIKDSSGKIIYGSVQPEMKQALTTMQELYKMGAFDPEFAVKDNGKMAESITAGKIGIYYGIFSGPIDPIMQLRMKDPTIDWEVLSIPTAKAGETIVPPAKPFAQRWVVARKDYKNPEAIVKSMNLWYSSQVMEQSKEYKEWLDINSPGGKYEGKLAAGYSKPYPFLRVDANINISDILLEVKKTGDKSKLTPGGVTILSMIDKGDPLGWAFGKVFYESEVVLKGYKTLKYTDYFGAPTATMVSKSASLDKLEAETFIKIIMGAPISEFDDFVAKWHSLGGDQIAQEIEANLK